MNRIQKRKTEGKGSSGTKETTTAAKAGNTGTPPGLGTRKRHPVEVCFSDADFEWIEMTCKLNGATVGELCTVLLQEDFGRRSRQFDHIAELRAEMAVTP